MSDRETQPLPEEAMADENHSEETVIEGDATAAPEEESACLARERDEFYDQLLRKQAELENYRKRVMREKEELRVLVRSDMIRELLLVLDAGEKGLETLQHETSDEHLATYRDGFELVVRQLEKLLDRYGVHPVPGVGFEFDPRYHEAVAREASEEHPDGSVMEEFRRGYLIGDHLVRPSQVKVAMSASEDPGGDGDG